MKHREYELLEYHFMKDNTIISVKNPDAQRAVLDSIKDGHFAYPAHIKRQAQKELDMMGEGSGFTYMVRKANLLSIINS